MPTAVAETYAAHQRAVFQARLPGALAAGLAIVVLFEVLAWLLIPEQFAREWVGNVLLIVVFLVPLAAWRTSLREHPILLGLLADVGLTSALVLRLLLPSTLTSGITVAITIKMLGTAALIPWPGMAQAMSVAGVLGLYWALLVLTGRTATAGGELPYQLTAPIFAAVLSVIGSYRSERLRRTNFAQRREIEAEARAATTLTATMSHELRNALTAVHGYVDMLQDDAARLPPPQAEILRHLGGVTRQALDTINVSLDLSRLGAEEVPVQIEPVALPALFDELAGEVEVPPGMDLAVTWDVAPDTPTIDTDALKLRMVLRNLVGNAVKYTLQGRVAVRAAPDDGGVVVEVADTGPGIPVEDQAAVFDPFHRGAGEIRRSRGAGLGLYVVSRLVEVLGGRITLDSTPGRGSTFRVRLPRALRRGTG